jgi:hypothetical protein
VRPGAGGGAEAAEGRPPPPAPAPRIQRFFSDFGDLLSDFERLSAIGQYGSACSRKASPSRNHAHRRRLGDWQR